MAGIDDEALLGEIGRKRGSLLPGGRVNLQKAAEIAINDFRSGAWGRITLESPTEFAQWLAAGQLLDAERQARIEARGKKKPQRQSQDLDEAGDSVISGSDSPQA
jgi:ribosome biogenesis GTPase A